MTHERLVLVWPLRDLSTGAGVSSACSFVPAITRRRSFSASGCHSVAPRLTHFESTGGRARADGPPDRLPISRVVCELCGCLDSQPLVSTVCSIASCATYARARKLVSPHYRDGTRHTLIFGQRLTTRSRGIRSSARSAPVQCSLSCCLRPICPSARGERHGRAVRISTSRPHGSPLFRSIGQHRCNGESSRCCPVDLDHFPISHVVIERIEGGSRARRSRPRRGALIALDCRT